MNRSAEILILAQFGFREMFFMNFHVLCLSFALQPMFSFKETSTTLDHTSEIRSRKLGKPCQLRFWMIVVWVLSNGAVPVACASSPRSSPLAGSRRDLSY